MVIRGRIENGVVVLKDDVSLPEGTEVSVFVLAKHDASGETVTDEQQRRYREALARIDAVPNENPGDTISGADHDQVLYGEGL
jgi:predicted DNA-binding antitoxin AbrB/MazE fold protein